jgi:hypothetical protein
MSDVPSRSRWTSARSATALRGKRPPFPQSAVDGSCVPWRNHTDKEPARSAAQPLGAKQALQLRRDGRHAGLVGME